MPKQIFQRQIPVRHDHWTKKAKAGVPARRGGKHGPKKPVPPSAKPEPETDAETKLPK